MRKHCTVPYESDVPTSRRQQRGAVDTPVAYADETERECRGCDAQPDPEPLGDGCGQIGERHADQQRGRRIGREHAARELVRLMTGRDRVAHALEVRGVVGRDAVQDVSRRDHEVAVEVERPGARAGVEARRRRASSRRSRSAARTAGATARLGARQLPARARARTGARVPRSYELHRSRTGHAAIPRDGERRPSGLRLQQPPVVADDARPVRRLAALGHDAETLSARSRAQCPAVVVVA